MVVGKEDLLNVCDTEFCKCSRESRTTRINEECAVSITENACVDMPVVNV
jgi:hypothetical protein